MNIMDLLCEESTERLRIVAEHAEGVVEVIYNLRCDVLRLHSITALELKSSNGKLADSLATVRALRRVVEENDTGDRWRQKELLVDIAKLREDLYQERGENKRLLLAKTSPNPMEHVVYALAQSYESELEKLRTQIGMMRENYTAIQLSDAWLKSELTVMDRSVPPPFRPSAVESAAATVNGDALTASGATRPLASSLRMRSSLDRCPRNNSRLPVNTSCSLQGEKVIRQDYVFLRVASRWTRLYCILSQARTLLFFDSADDFSQSRHIVSLDFIRRLTPVSSPPQMFVVELEHCKEAGGHFVEIAFAGKNERSLWMVLLHSQLNLTGRQPQRQ